LDLAFLVTPSKVHSRNTFVTYPLHVRHSSPNSQFLWTMTVYSTVLVVLSFTGYRTPSTDSVLPDVAGPAGHYLEGWIGGSVKSKHHMPPVMDSEEAKPKKTLRRVMRPDFASSPLFNLPVCRTWPKISQVARNWNIERRSSTGRSSHRSAKLVLPMPLPYPMILTVC